MLLLDVCSPGLWKTTDPETARNWVRILADVGVDFIKSYIQLEGLRIAAEDMGGTQPRKVVYFPASGRAKLRKLPPVENRIISHHEQLYRDSLKNKAADGGDVDLFE